MTNNNIEFYYVNNPGLHIIFNVRYKIVCQVSTLDPVVTKLQWESCTVRDVVAYIMAASVEGCGEGLGVAYFITSHYYTCM